MKHWKQVLTCTVISACWHTYRQKYVFITINAAASMSSAQRLLKADSEKLTSASTVGDASDC